MTKYTVSYIDVEEEVTHVTVEADSIEEAEENVSREYWDIECIIQTVKQ